MTFAKFGVKYFLNDVIVNFFFLILMFAFYFFFYFFLFIKPYNIHMRLCDTFRQMENLKKIQVGTKNKNELEFKLTLIFQCIVK